MQAPVCGPADQKRAWFYIAGERQQLRLSRGGQRFPPQQPVTTKAKPIASMRNTIIRRSPARLSRLCQRRS